MTKSKSKTGFRNGKLFCFNCGESLDMNLPQLVSMTTAMMKQFDKDHKACPPTWKEPEPDMTQSKQQRAEWWWQNGERGTSSETMFKYLCDRHIPMVRMSHPHDPDDFRRCYLLLKAVPEWKNDLYKLVSISPTWRNLVDNWDKLTAMLEELIAGKKDNGMSEFMESLGC